MADNTTLIIADVGAAILFMTTASSAAPSPVGTLNIISCPTNIETQPGESVEISFLVQAINGNASKTIQIVAGSYSDSKLVTLDENQTVMVTFTIPNVTESITYTVSVI